jgi:hypothetical protein
MAFSRFYTPEYLIRYPSGLFIFRIKVPLDCHSSTPQKELRYSHSGVPNGVQKRIGLGKYFFSKSQSLPPNTQPESECTMPNPPPGLFPPLQAD